MGFGPRYSRPYSGFQVRFPLFYLVPPYLENSLPVCPPESSLYLALRSRFERQKDVFHLPSNRSRMRVSSSDIASAYEIGGTHQRLRLVLDELANWPSKELELFSVLIGATGKDPDTQAIILSKAGFDPEHSWQYQVRADAEHPNMV